MSMCVINIFHNMLGIALTAEPTPLVMHEDMVNWMFNIVKFMIPIIIAGKMISLIVRLMWDGEPIIDSHDNCDIRKDVQKQREKACSKPLEGEKMEDEAKKNDNEPITLDNCVALVDKLQKLDLPQKYISCLEQIKEFLKKIVSKARELPEEPEYVQRVVNYYLPTLVDITTKYSEFRKMDLQNEEVQESKQEIKKTVNAMVEAFSELVHKMYQKDVYDAGTDAQVLRSVLVRDGLIDEMELTLEGNEDYKKKK